MYVEQIMSREVDTVTADMKISHASRLMKERDRRYLPVVDTDGRLVGLLGRKHLKQAEPSSITTLSVGEVNYLTSKVTVGQLMEKHPISCSRRTLIEQAGQMIRERKVGCLPVVEDERVIGVISETDILDFFLDITGSNLTETTRIAVKLPNKVRELANFLNKISDGGGYISSVVSPTSESSKEKRTVIVRYIADDPDKIDRQLRELGFEIISEDLPGAGGTK
ncbi:MAG: CBS domain-containing protein [Gammaproteobacteria bacterium]|nr:CBS domain-containing protein [Gammaproteobacteria bacterium]MCB1872951.1 CBS domain-containing protein [Gammaproteobacteria bacterium]MCB1879256.1 CBS domain-containing protein [Gammaproteobacteria bacterium]MCB1904095.1 CBS domain-containing protein [Gammaproteobacteria bacterium]